MSERLCEMAINSNFSQAKYERILNDLGWPSTANPIHAYARGKGGPAARYGSWLRKREPDKFLAMYEEWLYTSDQHSYEIYCRARDKKEEKK
jgi:hypothetical protein